MMKALCFLLLLWIVVVLVFTGTMLHGLEQQINEALSAIPATSR